MALGVSTHTTTPFRPYCPSRPFWVSHPCHRSSSVASSKTLHRGVLTVQSANSTFPLKTKFCRPRQFQRSLCYQIGTNRYDNSKYECRIPHLELVVQLTDCSPSSARMLLQNPQHSSSEGKCILGGVISQQKIDREKQVFRHPSGENVRGSSHGRLFASGTAHKPTLHRTGDAKSWHKLTERMKVEKREVEQDGSFCLTAKFSNSGELCSENAGGLDLNTENNYPQMQDSTGKKYKGKSKIAVNGVQSNGSLSDLIGDKNTDVSEGGLNNTENNYPQMQDSTGKKYKGKSKIAVNGVQSNGSLSDLIGDKNTDVSEGGLNNTENNYPQMQDSSGKKYKGKSKIAVNGVQSNGSLSDLIGDKNTDVSEGGLNNKPSADDVDVVKTSTAKEVNGICQPDLRERLSSIYDNVLVVDNIFIAKKVVRMLTNQFRHLIHACDTEVAKIDVKKETPIDHGEVICFSIYSGPKADFGNGKSCIWVDVLDGGGRDLLFEFAPFFEDPSIKKVWHNYSFDNHVLENYGLKVSGFHADTMHMARLWDSSRRTAGGYSLEVLTGDSRVMSGAQLCDANKLIGKISMKTIFGRKKLKKDGSEGKIINIAPVEVLQREERKPWICYSALDSISTLKLYESLKSHLSKMAWKLDGIPVSQRSMFDFYKKYWRPFGELLVKMETEGMLVDRTYLAELEKLAKTEQVVASNRFRNWASRYCPDAKFMNVGSDAQLRQLFFGGTVNRRDHNDSLPVERIFKIPNVDKVIEEGKKTPTKYRNIRLHSLGVMLPTEMYTATGWPSVSGDALKILAGKVSAEFDFIDDAHDLDDDVESPGTMIDKVPETQESTVCEEEDLSAYQTAVAAFKTKDEGREACHAIAALCEVCSIDSLISNFILPLQGNNISGKNGRVHCSLNINTETGRLSARRPNLQNQPALEKDRYKIRQAFIASPGNSLIVADYGQLELRILAHLANCKSMLDAFKAGGDFHSRTAMNMYPHIREAIETEQVLLEWHPQPGEDRPPVPLLKDAFASERRKAKMLNFSIAYGKTPVGLARDWKVSVEEAKRTVDLWYRERKEVLSWQESRKKEALKDGCVHTLLGRARRFPSLAHATRAQRGHIERAAINTPVQGSAADVAMCAMLEISKNVPLKDLGWRLLLQVHDEVILEGPTESAEVAKSIVVECMSKPFNGKNFLEVDLSVDAKCAQNWYSAK